MPKHFIRKYQKKGNGIRKFPEFEFENILFYKIKKITILTEAVPLQTLVPIDLSILLSIPKEIKINLVIDESNSLGIIGNECQNALKSENISIIRIASLTKALGFRVS